jgi:hypothetical protein
MKPLLYEIGESVERQLREVIEGNGGLLVPRRELKKTAEAEEQYWSATVNNEEIFWFCIAVESTGRRLLMMGPKRESPHARLYDLVVNALEPSGARRLEKL